MDSTDIMFLAIYNHVKEFGEMVPKKPGSMGGIWGGDVWKGSGFTVMLVDDGWSKSIRAYGLHCYKSGSDKITFYEGSKDDLHSHYTNLVMTEQTK